ncbi:replication initiation factor domain-containing protein [Streptococcus didelphis]|uniref:replication initiation factor domain-containing protein n=1 Tax=Streptococcus didelphis TaxID=102886 RepID=UPI00037F9B3C|nr:replication initiation factor domain-containing protein [Streptococcus didelphis]
MIEKNQITGQEMKQIRKELDFNQKQMSGLLDIKLSTYKMYEQEKRKLPKEVIERFFMIMSRRSGHSLEGSIDWLKIRFKTLDYESIIKEVMKMKVSDFYDSDKTFYGYQDMITFGNIRILFSHDIEKINEGTLVEFTGLGCREFESILLEQKREWWEFFQSVFEYAENHRNFLELEDFLAFNRFDIALDELYKEDGSNVDLHDLRKRISAGKIKVNIVDNILFDEGLKRVKGVFVNSGLTIYLGSRQSDVFIRFYEKDLEQSLALKVVPEYIHEVLGLKNRYEIELHAKKAFQAVYDYMLGEDLAVMGCRILINYLDVYNWDDSLDLKWQSLVGLYGGYKFVTKPRRYDYSRSKKWISRSAGGTLLLMKFESVLEKRDLVSDVLEEAVFNEKQEKVARMMAEKKKLNYEEVLDIAKGY